MVENIKTTVERGESARNSFFKRIATFTEEGSNDDKTHPTYTRIKSHDNLSSPLLIKKRDRSLSIPEDEGQSFADIMNRYDKQVLDIEYIMKWPVTTFPWAICKEEEKSRTCSKAVFRNYLQRLNPVKPIKDGLNISCTVVDAMRIVRIIPITGLKPPTFQTWLNKVLDHIMKLPGNVIHIVFDVYSPLPDLTRPSKTRNSFAGQRRYLSDLSQQLPPLKNAWVDFLSNNANKHDLTNLITDFILSTKFVARCPVYVT